MVVELEKELAFTSVFLYKLYFMTKDVIKYNSRQINKVISLIKDHCAAIGWALTTIQNILNDITQFPVLEKASEAIRSLFLTNIITYPETSPTSVLFEKVCHVGDNLTAKNKIQEIYLKKEMKNFNEAFLDILKKTWKFNRLQKLMKQKKYQANKSFKNNISQATSKRDISFFRSVWIFYCPVEGTHDFKNKICKFCGISSDGENVDEIFNKNIDKITNYYVHSVHIPEYSLPKVKNTVLEEIDKLQPNPFGTINSNMKDKLLQEIQNNEQPAIKFIESLTNTKIKIPENINNYILKGLTYLTKNYLNEKDVFNELANLYFSVNDILTIIF
jgi:hypothetical protein